MLGEFVKPSCATRGKSGETVRTAGYNDYIIGDDTDEGNLFFEILKGSREKIQCFMINTGGTGEITEETESGRQEVKHEAKPYEISDISAIIRGIISGAVSWKKNEALNTLVPETVEGADLSACNPLNRYSEEQYLKLTNELKKERKAYLSGFSGLLEEIKLSFE